MHPSFKDIVESRTSINHFEPSRPVSDDDIGELVRLATLSPSAYNFQNWKFIAVRTPEAKARLKAASHGQQKVADASVTFIVCGTLRAHEGLAGALQPSVDAGVLGQGVADGWVRMARQAHPGDPQLQRDEAIRSASLAAMTLMLAAQAMGLASCSLSGFEADAVARSFHLADHELPVILVAVGHAATGNWPRKPRKPVADVIALV